MVCFVAILLVFQIGTTLPKAQGEASHSEIEMVEDKNLSIQDDPKKVSFLMEKEDLRQSDLLQDIDERSIEGYGQFVLVRVNRDTAERLDKESRAAQRIEKGFETPAGRFQLRREGSHFMNGEGPQLSLLRFIGPPKSGWREILEEQGVSLYERLGTTVYLASMEPRNIEKVRDDHFIERVAPYGAKYKIDGELKEKHDLERRKRIDIELKLSKDASLEELQRLDAVRGASLLSFSNGSLNYDRASLSVRLDRIKNLAEMPNVVAIKEEQDYKLLNDRSSWVTQSYDEGYKKEVLWEHGILGQNQIIGIADTGLDYDHVMFRDTKNSAGTPRPDHRKVVMYKEYANGTDTDFSGHGTHVSGSAAGDWKDYGVPNDHDGMAPAAKIAFYDVGESGDKLVLPDDIGTVFQEQYENGSRIFSNSWGSSSSDYTEDSYSCDEFMWNHNDAILLFASGNSGPDPNTVASPASAKSLVSVGNSINGISQDMAASSSHGPTDQGRLKPTVVAPGTSIISADSDGDPSTMNDKFMHLSGTSMATPTMAGVTALARQYYQEGWHERGVKDTEAGFVPSGSLLKATLINSAWSMNGHYTEGSIPSNGQGWGKIKLDDTLYFKGDSKRLKILNDGNSSSFSSSGESHEHDLYVGDDEALKVTLTWTDYPGSSLQNDLNLKVTAPDGTEYIGNVFSNGHSISGGQADDNNVSEQVLLESENVQEGKYTVEVIGKTISHGPQMYSLIASGDISSSTATVSFKEERYNIPPVNKKVGIELRDSDLNTDSYTVESATVNVASDLESSGEEVTLLESAQDSGIFKGTIDMDKDEVSTDGKLQVEKGDTLTVEYNDESSGMNVQDSSIIDTEAPVISKIEYPSAEEDTLMPTTARIGWSTDEKTYSRIEYGKTIQLGNTEESSYNALDHSVVLDGLEPNTTYCFKIISVDRAKSPNVAVHDNDGALHCFKTPDWPVPMGEGYSGYTYSVSTDEKSIFDRGYIANGYYYSMGFFGPREGHFNGAIMFDTSDMKSSDIASAELRLFPQQSYHPSICDESWQFEVLTDQIEGDFPAPSYVALKNADIDFTVDSVLGSDMASGFRGQSVMFPEDKLDQLESNMQNGKIVIRMRVPVEVDHLDMVSWYSGHSVEKPLLMKSPRLEIRTTEETSGTIEFDRDDYPGEGHAHIYLRDDDLNGDQSTRESFTVDVNSPTDSESVNLEETRANSSRFKGHVRLSNVDGTEDGILGVSDLDTITVSYLDQGIEKKDEAIIDAVYPAISDVSWNPKKDLTCTINWTTDEAASSKVVYGGTEDMNTVVSEDSMTTQHQITITNLVKDKRYYFKVSSMDKAGNTVEDNNGGELFMFTTPSQDIQPSILLVEDDGNATGYKNSLDGLGLDYSFETKADDVLPSHELDLYDIVIWTVGGFSDTLVVEERNLLADYLDQGGRLYINGEDIGFDIGDRSFYRNYLHADYLNDTSDSFTVDGIANDPISDGFNDLSIGGEYPSEVGPIDSYASTVFNYGSGKSAGIKADNSNYRVVYFAFKLFEGTEDQSVKQSLMNEIVNWLNPQGIDDKGPSVGPIKISPDNCTWNQTVEITGEADDSVSSGSEIEEIVFSLDVPDEDLNEVVPTDGSYGDVIEDFKSEIDVQNLSEGDHFVYVKAKDTSGNWGEFEKRQFEVGSTGNYTEPSPSLHEIQLDVTPENEGWQFVSTYLEPTDDDIESVLNDAQYGIEGDYDKVMTYDSKQDEWLTYEADRPSHFNSLNRLDRRNGYWIHLLNDTTLTVEGEKVLSSQIKLNPGWNMVGFPSNDSRGASSTLPGEVTKIGIYNGSRQNHIEYTEELDQVILENGMGYWVFNSADETISWTLNF